MKKASFFKTTNNKRLKLPLFFPDATQAVLKTLDSVDIKNTHTPGILVNTYHLSQNPGQKVIEKHQGIGNFINWNQGLISDSGGFQIFSLAQKNPKKITITDQGITFPSLNNQKNIFTPEISIKLQMAIKPDMVVALDDFTPKKAAYAQAEQTVNRTILWAKRSKQTFLKHCRQAKLSSKNRPYLLAVIQGGEYLDLRKKCLNSLVKIGFDGFGYGGWPLNQKGKFNYQVAKCITKNTPSGRLLYGLGIGKPEDIVNCVDLGFHIFDCVLPTRDARHQRLYVYQANSINRINIRKPKFYSYYFPAKKKHHQDTSPVSQACDCLLCQNYTRAYLAHLFRIKEVTAKRLATIHNLRFYSLLMEKLQQEK